ncbi:MAG: DUF1282 domain-containing protein [Alphaproteobacteria bacterium]|nr:MAG: DUF1282 domain-containing protein [Alphaproteobacteria bacterium]
MTAIAGVDIAALADRVKNILMKPAAEWDKISGEKPLLPDLFTRYVAILAAIPALCGFLGSMIFGFSAGGYTVRPSFGIALEQLVVGYIMAFIGVGICGMAVEFLAPHFGGKTDRISAFKLAIYSMTASWMSGVFMLLPSVFKILGLLGLYSIYIFYLGVPKLTTVPADKAGTFTAVVAIVSILVGLVVGLMMMGLR